MQTTWLGNSRRNNIALLVAALGYFVDVFDLALFSIVRVESLQSLGLSHEQVLTDGVRLLNMQMLGMLIGGILWGILGDKWGRVQILFGSILLYSLANIGNGFVASVEQYAILRLLAGIGLAGEIGGGVTLVSELMPREKRGLSTAIIAASGGLGAVFAGTVAEFLSWRTAYFVGGGMGLVLLAARVGVHESGMFKNVVARQDVSRGSLFMIFSSWDRFARYTFCFLVGVPMWFVVGIIATLAPELATALGVAEPIKAGKCLTLLSIGIAVGDITSGILSQYLRSRKRVIGYCLISSLALAATTFRLSNVSAVQFYPLFLALGFFLGYWAVLITTAAEQFGTNMRATVATSIPNLIRGATIPITSLFMTLKGSYGVLGAAEIVGLCCFTLAFVGLWGMRETFGIDLNYLEGAETEALGVAER